MKESQDHSLSLWTIPGLLRSALLLIVIKSGQNKKSEWKESILKIKEKLLNS